MTKTLWIAGYQHVMDETGNVLQLMFARGIAGGGLPLEHGVTYEQEKDWKKQQRNLEKNSKPIIAPSRWKLDEVIKRGVQDVKIPLR